jgi:hypothetical protein
MTMKNGVFWDVLTRATRRNIPEGFFQEPHGVTSQKTPFFNLVAVLIKVFV